MATSQPALVNPKLLAWAREQGGFAAEPVAKRIGVKPERLLAWEGGGLRPTVRQAQELARLYRRPFGLFFLPQPPQVTPLASEYRRLPGIVAGEEPPELRLALRLMSYRREIALNLTEELGGGSAAFDTAAHLSESPSVVGARCREALGVSVDEQLRWTSDWQAWRRWREAVEAAGVLVFQFPKVTLEQVRGVSLLLSPLPVVGINSKESSPGARVFTLLHELIHIALSVGADERVASGEKRDATAWADVERFAEESASAAIIPEQALSMLLEDAGIARDRWTIALVRQLASKFHVTPLAMATRLRTAGAMTWDGYAAWKSEWTRYVANLAPSAKGFATPVSKALGRAGRPLIRLVIEALDANRITAVDACNYLELRFDHFDKLRSELRGLPGGAQSADDAE